MKAYIAFWLSLLALCGCAVMSGPEVGSAEWWSNRYRSEARAPGSAQLWADRNAWHTVPGR